MRITTVTTGDQRRAVLHAAQAADILTDRIIGAHLVEFAATDHPSGTVRAYDLFQIWPPEPDGEQVWADALPHPTWAPGGHLTADDIDRVQWLLQAAGEADPNVFDPDELAANAWQLNLPAVLELADRDALDRLVAHFHDDPHRDRADLAELVTLQIEGMTDLPAHDVVGNIRLLLRELGEREAWYAIETL